MLRMINIRPVPKKILKTFDNETNAKARCSFLKIIVWLSYQYQRYIDRAAVSAKIMVHINALFYLRYLFINNETFFLLPGYIYATLIVRIL